jgi:GNAT superfamily N-acetyltransferase
MAEPDNSAEQADNAERFRLALTADRGAVEEVVKQAYQPWARTLGFRPGPMDEDYTALIDARRVYVTGEVVDGLMVLTDEDGCLVVENVAVRPERQGHGIGRALLAFAEREAVRRGKPALRLYTHEQMASNIALYLTLGYVETHRESAPVGRLVHLRKSLTQAR